jgi:hypothetical protein
MRKSIINIFMLLVIPLTLIPVILGAADEIEARRKDHFWNMRREHLRSMARDRKRRALRAQARETAEASETAETPARKGFTASPGVASARVHWQP